MLNFGGASKSQPINDFKTYLIEKTLFINSICLGESVLRVSNQNSLLMPFTSADNLSFFLLNTNQ